MKSITVSIVSHGHETMLVKLLDQLASFYKHISMVIVTFNIPGVKLDLKKYPFAIHFIENNNSSGFAANHNKAFKLCKTEYYCVINPDIQLLADPFSRLLTCGKDKKIGVIGPRVVNINYQIEDSARFFPTPWGLVLKLFGKYDGVYPATKNADIDYTDWLAGMFLVIKSDVYKKLSGFDEAYYLYYEDVDFCLRTWQAGYTVVLCKNTQVIHDARRSSHKNLKYLLWHLKSAWHFFYKNLFRFPNEKIN